MTEPADAVPVRDYPVGDPDALTPVVYQSSSDGQYRWRLRAVNHRRIGASTEGYGNQDDCIANCLTVTQRSAIVLQHGIDIDAINDTMTALTSVAEFTARPVR